MSKPKLQHIYNSVERKLTLPKDLLPSNGVPQSHHFQSTDGDNLIELSGRVCYDSAKSPSKTRGTGAYHVHINEVKHSSVQGHLSLTICLTNVYKSVNDVLSIYQTLVNRPGFFLVPSDEGLRITYNIRCINDWYKFSKYHSDEKLFWTLTHNAIKYAPLACKFTKVDSTIYEYKEVEPVADEEIWLSFYISNISRGLSHELVRHGFHTAISQRSTRYVDESDSEWSSHPLILKYWTQLNQKLNTTLDKVAPITNFENQSKDLYKNIVDTLESLLINDGVDKFIARKQARGAARGYLGNALSTEMIWSASLDEIREIILQRCSEGADAEIRLWANELYNIVIEKFPSVLSDLSKRDCSDGIGFEVYIPTTGGNT
jgi:flavin-dependent thymidylate synthase